MYTDSPSYFTRARRLWLIAGATCSLISTGWGGAPQPEQTQDQIDRLHREQPVSPPEDTVRPSRGRTTSSTTTYERDGFVSVQVNVDGNGDNVVGDAGNEPSIAIDATAPGTLVIGWRQFDTVLNNFRQAGVAYSMDAGQSWTNPGVLEPNVFSSDPVLDYDLDGRMYYYALQPDRGPGPWACYMYRSVDGGVSWPQEVYAFGGDKAWFAVDRTEGIGRGNIYIPWTPNTQAGCCGVNNFTRSTDHGATWMNPIPMPVQEFSATASVGPDGALYVFGSTFAPLPTFNIIKSTDAQNANVTPTFSMVTEVDLDGVRVVAAGPNPGGLLGQAWVATDHSNGPTHGNVYALSTVQRLSVFDPADVMFARSTDGGETWSDPIRVNDDPEGSGAWQWFGTMSVAPNGRIDVIFNDTRSDLLPSDPTFSELFYTSSVDGGETWSENIPVSPAFNHSLGYPNQNKLGDYYDMISDLTGASVAYAATFNGEQDVYYLRIGATDCNGNGEPDAEDIALGRSDDCDENAIPDECQQDCDGDGTADACEVLAGAEDCDGDLKPDTCERDFDGDSLIDDCDPDSDNDGVEDGSDLCDFSPAGFVTQEQGHLLGDFDVSCVIDLADFRELVDCVSTNGPNDIADRVCAFAFDMNRDGFVMMDDAAEFLVVHAAAFEAGAAAGPQLLAP